MVRSTWWALALAAVGMVVLGALFCARYGIEGISPADRASFDPAAYSLSGFFLAQLAVGVLGVLAITSEYATGSIRATFAAIPQRRAVLAAKAVVLAAITALVRSPPYLPSDAGQALIGRTKFAPQGLHLLSPWVGFAVVCAYAAATLIAATVVLSRRDAL
jgi:ABC-type transport system involved in multi-copper enzyme maturation permease subunit